MKQWRFGRFVLRWTGREWSRPFWFQTWRPVWHGGSVRYVTLGIGPIAFYAGDPRPKPDRIEEITRKPFDGTRHDVRFAGPSHFSMCDRCRRNGDQPDPITGIWLK